MLYPTTCVGLRYGCRTRMLSGFSREYGYPRSQAAPGGGPYCQVRLRGCTSPPPSAPTPFNALFRQRAEVSLLRHRVAAYGSHGMLTVCPSPGAVRLGLRVRLTPG